MGMFISTLLVVDTFFVSYYLGMHSRSVPVVDNSMKPVVPAVVRAKTPVKADVKAATKPSAKAPAKSSAKPTPNGAKNKKPASYKSAPKKPIGSKSKT